MTEEDRAILREEIKNVLAETYTVLDLFDRPINRALIGTVVSCMAGCEQIMPVDIAADRPNYQAAQKMIRAQLRMEIRSYMTQAKQAETQNLPY